jgi:hypothetical protein
MTSGPHWVQQNEPGEALRGADPRSRSRAEAQVGHVLHGAPQNPFSVVALRLSSN